MVTAAKLKWDDPNSLVIRLYQASNEPVLASLSINGTAITMNGVTAINALELPLDVKRQDTVSVSVNAEGGVDVQMNRALATLQIPLNSLLP